MQQNSLIDVTQRPGFIIILSNPSFPNSVIIGKTTRLPYFRAAELTIDTGVPSPFKVEYDRFVGRELKTLEIRIHQKLAKYRISNDRESFQLTVSQAIEKIDKIIDRYFSHGFAKQTYRHHQHAQWACFFECIQVPFTYLACPVVLSGQVSFQPDFWLPDQDCFLIISEDLFSNETGKLAGLYFAQKTGKVLLRFWECQPGVEKTSDDDIILHTGQYATPEGDFDGAIEWGVCPTCGSRHVGHLGHAELGDIASRNTSPKNCQCYNILNPHRDLMRAYNMVAYIFDQKPL